MSAHTHKVLGAGKGDIRVQPYALCTYHNELCCGSLLDALH